MGEQEVGGYVQSWSLDPPRIVFIGVSLNWWEWTFSAQCRRPTCQCLSIEALAPSDDPTALPTWNLIYCWQARGHEGSTSPATRKWYPPSVCDIIRLRSDSNTHLFFYDGPNKWSLFERRGPCWITETEYGSSADNRIASPFHGVCPGKQLLKYDVGDRNHTRSGRPG
jgi:hypothetical protein